MVDFCLLVVYSASWSRTTCDSMQTIDLSLHRTFFIVSVSSCVSDEIINVEQYGCNNEDQGYF